MKVVPSGSRSASRHSTDVADSTGLAEMTANRLENLSSGDCWTLLRATSVARLAVVTDQGPDIFPINFVVDHGTVVFRTAAGTKLLAALASDTVALEADDLDVATNKVWSVVIKGHASEISGLQATIDTFDLSLFPWHESPKNRFIRITPSEITGRRFSVTDPTHWAHPLTGAPHAAIE